MAFPDVTGERRHGTPASCFGIDEANCPRRLLEPIPPAGERSRPNQVVGVAPHHVPTQQKPAAISHCMIDCKSTESKSNGSRPPIRQPCST